MVRLLLDAIWNGDENHAHNLIVDGIYGCVDSQTSRRDGTALFFCCSSGYFKLAQMLLARGASVHAQNKSGANPLHAAADKGHLDIVRLLVCHGADVNAQTQRGDTALHLAAYRGHSEVIKCLVTAGADPRLVNQLRLSAETAARGGGFLKVSDYLRGVCQESNPSLLKDAKSDSMIHVDPPPDIDFMFGSSGHHQQQTAADSALIRRRHSETIAPSRNAVTSRPCGEEHVFHQNSITSAPPLTSHIIKQQHIGQPNNVPIIYIHPDRPYTWGGDGGQIHPDKAYNHWGGNGGYRRPSSCSNSSYLSETSTGSDQASLVSDFSSGFGEFAIRKDGTVCKKSNVSSVLQTPDHIADKQYTPHFPGTDTPIPGQMCIFLPPSECINRNAEQLQRQFGVHYRRDPPYDDVSNIYDSSAFSLTPLSSFSKEAEDGSPLSRFCSTGSTSSYLSTDSPSPSSISSSGSEAPKSDDYFDKPALDKRNACVCISQPPAPPPRCRSELSRSCSVQPHPGMTNHELKGPHEYRKSLSVDQSTFVRFGCPHTIQLNGTPLNDLSAPNQKETSSGTSDFKLGPGYTRSESVEVKPYYAPFLLKRLDRDSVAGSNDLSFSSTSQSSSSDSSGGSGPRSTPMTCVNIPLN